MLSSFAYCSGAVKDLGGGIAFSNWFISGGVRHRGSTSRTCSRGQAPPLIRGEINHRSACPRLLPIRGIVCHLSYFDICRHFRPCRCCHVNRFIKEIECCRKNSSNPHADRPMYGDTNHKPHAWWSAARCCAVVCLFPPAACKEASMARTNLRIYRGPADKTTAVRPASTTSPATIKVSRRSAAAAGRCSRQPPNLASDFEDDEITISADLYEVLLGVPILSPPGGLDQTIHASTVRWSGMRRARYASLSIVVCATHAHPLPRESLPDR